MGTPFFDGVAGVDSGRVQIFLAVDASEWLVLGGEAAGDVLGARVANVPDVDGDGIEDVAAAAPLHDGPAGTDSGRVYLVSGATGALIRAIDGPSANAAFGASLSGIGDLDGDGAGDVVVGGVDLAQVRSGADGSVIHAWTGGRDSFGFSVSRAGDVNDDGFEDVVVGDPGPTEGAPPQPPFQVDAYVQVFSGATGEPLAFLSVFDTKFVSGQLGYSVSDVGDLNGDGRADVLAGAPAYSPFASAFGGGAAFVFSVPPTPF